MNTTLEGISCSGLNVWVDAAVPMVGTIRSETRRLGEYVGPPEDWPDQTFPGILFDFAPSVVWPNPGCLGSEPSDASYGVLVILDGTTICNRSVSGHRLSLESADCGLVGWCDGVLTDATPIRWEITIQASNAHGSNSPIGSSGTTQCS